MLLNYFLDGATIGDYYLLLIPSWALFLGVVGTLVLGVGSMWLANLPQPKPSPGLWALSEVDREVRAQRRGESR